MIESEKWLIFTKNDLSVFVSEIEKELDKDPKKFQGLLPPKKNRSGANLVGLDSPELGEGRISAGNLSLQYFTAFIPKTAKGYYI